MTAEEAVGLIQNGMRVVIAPGCGEPRSLVNELARQHKRFDRLEVVGGFLCGDMPLVAPGMEKHFHYITWHVTRATRKAVAQGYASYVPLRYSEVVPALSPGGALRADVLLCVVSATDSSGFLSLGPSVSFTKPLSEITPLIIAERNPNVPWTLGESILERHLINSIVFSDAPLAEYPHDFITQVERTIARFVAELIPDGATLQIGVGAVPEAVLDILYQHRDLAIHSIVTDGMMELIERGVINARSKKVNPGRCEICEVMGSQKLFKFVDHHPLIYMQPATYTHNPRVMAQIDNFISINSALQIDLTGAVNSETLDGQVVAAVGGQFDFVLGSQLSQGGKSIFALPSTGGKDHAHSRIVPFLPPGNSVSVPRHLVQYVVTEYGIAELKGKTLEQRAKAMIKIAHPKFRDELESAFRKMRKNF